MTRVEDIKVWVESIEVEMIDIRCISEMGDPRTLVGETKAHFRANINGIEIKGKVDASEEIRRAIAELEIKIRKNLGNKGD